MLAHLFDYIVNWSNDPLGKVHVYLAVFALILGPIVFFSSKGTKIHRVLGFAFLISMLSVNISALLKYDLTGHFNLFHFAAIFSLMTIVPAYLAIVWAIKTRKIKYFILHGHLMAWSYYGLVMALIAEVTTRAVPYLLHGEGGWQRFSMALSVFMLISGLLSYQLINRGISRWYSKSPQTQ